MRPPGSNFGRVLHSQSTKYVPPKRVMSEKTKLRVAIQQAAIKNAELRNLGPERYTWALAKKMRKAKMTDMDETELAVLIDKTIFGPLERPKPVAWASDDT